MIMIKADPCERVREIEGERRERKKLHFFMR